MSARASWSTPHPRWSSGSWDLEIDGAGIAEVGYGGSRILRGVRAVVRDRDWNTCRMTLDSATTTGTTTGTALRLAIRSDDRGTALHGHLDVIAGQDALDLALDLTVDADLLANRVGLVVLQPASVSGSALTVTHPDGTATTTIFPSSISPHQPAVDIAALDWEAGGRPARLAFTGDVFEMEDQRNWTDASFKTYSRPLSLPFPYLLACGSRVQQGVRLTLGAGAPPVPPKSELLALRQDGVFPEIGVGASTAPDPGPSRRDPVGAALLVELDLAAPNWRAALERASATGDLLDIRFLLPDALPNTGQAALDEATAAIAGLAVARVSAFWPAGPSRHVSDGAAIAALRAGLARAGVHAAVVGGARSHFTELNREGWRLPHDLDGVVFAVTPLFHELGTRQLVESIAMQRLVAREAVHKAAGIPVHVGPITLRPRFNDCATIPPPTAGTTTLDEGYGAQFSDCDDPRQRLPQLAAWTVASAAAFAVPGVAGLSYFEDWGPRGIQDWGGADFPVAAGLRELARLSGAPLLHGGSVDDLVWAVGAEQGGHEVVLVSNLDSRMRTVTLVTPAARRVVTIGPESWCRVVTDP